MQGSEGAVFGVRADGQVMMSSYATLADAERYAQGLFQRGFREISIIDRRSGRPVKRVALPKKSES